MRAAGEPTCMAEAASVIADVAAQASVHCAACTFAGHIIGLLGIHCHAGDRRLNGASRLACAIIASLFVHLPAIRRLRIPGDHEDGTQHQDGGQPSTCHARAVGEEADAARDRSHGAGLASVPA